MVCPLLLPQNDHLGTPQKITSENGTVVWQARQDSFGQMDVVVEDIVNNLRFPGQYFDSETGLHYNWHRSYDPEIGRYITADPIGLAGGMNLYAYVLNNPINFEDPTGEFINFGAAGVGAAIGATVGAVNAVFNYGDILQGAMYGAGVGALAGLSFGTSLAANIAISATIGIGTDYLNQRISDPCKEINSTSLFFSGLSGAVGGGAGTATLKGGTSAITAALVGGGASGGISTKLNYLTSPGPYMVPYNPK